MEDQLLKPYQNCQLITPKKVTTTVSESATWHAEQDRLNKVLSGRKKTNKSWGIDNSVPVGDRD